MPQGSVAQTGTCHRWVPLSNLVQEAKAKYRELCQNLFGQATDVCVGTVKNEA